MNDLNAILRDRLPKPGNFNACFAFSIHKAGSSLMNAMIQDLCKLEGIPAVSIPDILFKEGILDAAWNSDKSLASCLHDGCIYYGFRYFPRLFLGTLSWLNERKTVLLVRDPRDSLVSEYFSFGGKWSHVLPKKNSDVYMEQHTKNADKEIDEYVREAADVHKQKLLTYLAYLNFDMMRLFRYEDIFFNKSKFLNEIFKHFGIPVSEASIAKVASKHDIRPKEEDASKHIRKATPGDHVEKLKPDTISYLNDFFADTCAKFGYDLHQ